MFQPRGKWPRHYAWEILGLRTREERREALSKVPEQFRDWVEYYVRDAFERKKIAKNIKTK